MSRYLGFYNTLNNWRERNGWFFLEERRRQKKKTALVVWAPRALCAIAKQRFSVFFFDEREKERKKERKTAVGTFLEHFTGDDRKRERERRKGVGREAAETFSIASCRKPRKRRRSRKMPSWTTKRGKKWTNPMSRAIRN